ncbi:hypothetical protein [Campylobacter sputorum]|uniref:hypothetical protein n=1 Tax=Campylobacter sputorum TaxID=206 RepID=UPI000B76CCC6|nr:hypothetical protein [Campylobacter sputorum]ASM36805.1 hypothetical protein CSF_0932 [Campylobacter sputorum bv. faecalis CCUG 20703]
MRQINIEATKDLLKEMRKWSYNNDFLIVAWEPIYKDEFQGKYINNEIFDKKTSVYTKNTGLNEDFLCAVYGTNETAESEAKKELYSEAYEKNIEDDEEVEKYINEKLDEYTDCIIDEWFKNDEPSKVDEDGEYHYFKSVDE